MQELVIKCTQISIIGYKDKSKFNTIKIYGMGLIINKFIQIIFKINPNITKDIIEIDDMMDIAISEHEGIKIMPMPNNKEIRLAVYNKNGNFELGITLFTVKKLK